MCCSRWLWVCHWHVLSVATVSLFAGSGQLLMRSDTQDASSVCCVGCYATQGVLSPDDARLALQYGVDGIIVSNHGEQIPAACWWWCWMMVRQRLVDSGQLLTGASGSHGPKTCCVAVLTCACFPPRWPATRLCSLSPGHAAINCCRSGWPGANLDGWRHQTRHRRTQGVLSGGGGEGAGLMDDG